MEVQKSVSALFRNIADIIDGDSGGGTKSATVAAPAQEASNGAHAQAPEAAEEKVLVQIAAKGKPVELPARKRQTKAGSQQVQVFYKGQWRMATKKGKGTYRLRATQQIDPSTYSWDARHYAVARALSTDSLTQFGQVASKAGLGRGKLLHVLRPMVSAGFVKTKPGEGQTLTAAGAEWLKNAPGPKKGKAAEGASEEAPKAAKVAK